MALLHNLHGTISDDCNWISHAKYQTLRYHDTIMNITIVQLTSDSGYGGSKASCEGYVPETSQEQIQKEPPAEPPLKHHRKKPPSNAHYVVVVCYLKIWLFMNCMASPLTPIHSHELDM